MSEPVTHTTQLLLHRIRDGDGAAKDELLRRVLPLFERWAHGRLPASARGSVETADLVQVSVIRAMARIDRFESAHPGAFFAYLRQILINAVRKTIGESSMGRQVAIDDVQDQLADQGSAVEQLVGRENLMAYEQALGLLPVEHQALVIMRFEFGMSFVEIADELGETPDGVRVKLNRALKKMVTFLGASDERG